MTLSPNAGSESRVLYCVVCAAPPALHVRSLVKLAQAQDWDVCVVTTPTAARWLDADRSELEELTGHPVRSTYKLPGQPDVLPPPSAILVAPATSNTINKWALGISDTLALGLITEGIGKGLPLVALPFLNRAQAAHPAFPRSVAVLREAGVNVLLGPDGYEPHGPGEAQPHEFPWSRALTALLT